VDETVTVPIEWLFTLAGFLIVGLFWWLRIEWQRNWKEHEEMKAGAVVAHAELDRRIDQRHTHLDRNIVRVHKRIDWIIAHSREMPAYPEDNDKDV